MRILVSWCIFDVDRPDTAADGIVQIIKPNLPVGKYLFRSFLAHGTEYYCRKIKKGLLHAVRWKVDVDDDIFSFSAVTMTGWHVDFVTRGGQHLDNEIGHILGGDIPFKNTGEMA